MGISAWPGSPACLCLAIVLASFLGQGVLPQGTPWGAAVDGLQARLAVSQAEVAAGSRIDFQLHLRCDPKQGDADVNLLNRGETAWDAELVFQATESDKVFRRRPFDVGMPPMFGPRHIVELRRGALPPERLTIYLLSDEGEQIPPGTYTVTAVYKNTAKPELEFRTDEAGRRHSRPDRGPWKYWKGTITSAPIRLTVTPAGPREVELKINSALLITRGKDGGRDTIGWSWSQHEPRSVKVKRRPGYIIGQRWGVHVFLDGREIGDQAGGGLSGSAWHGAGSRSFLEPEIVKRVLAGASLTVRADVEVFETSVPARHMWSPESGDFRILWKGSVRGELEGSAAEGPGAGEGARVLRFPKDRSVGYLSPGSGRLTENHAVR